MTVKELYEIACINGYENADIGLTTKDFQDTDIKKQDLKFGITYADTQGLEIKNKCLRICINNE